MKKLLTLILIVISYSVGMGQAGVLQIADTFDINLEGEDTLTDSRAIEDSIGNTYEIEYRYVGNNDLGVDSSGHRGFHQHYISLVNIIAFKGNKQHTIASNIKAIYSPVECIADNRELWLKRLYEIQNKKK